MSTLPPANWLRTFEAAARLGGFTAAGDALGLTAAAVSQQIRALETNLGFRLFDRRARGVELNEMGRAYLPSVQRAFEDLETATAGLFWAGEQTVVTVRAPISFATLCLAPLLHDFHKRHPQTAVRLCTALWADAAEDSSIDLDIHYGDGHWTGAEVVRLTQPISVLVCPPGTPEPTDQAAFLTDHARRAIHVSGYEGLWAGLGRRFGLERIEVGGTLAADSSLVALEMVAGGLGAAIVAKDLAQRHMAQGSVVAPSAFELEHKYAHYLVRPKRQNGPRPGALLFRTWLLSQGLGAASDA